VHRASTWNGRTDRMACLQVACVLHGWCRCTKNSLDPSIRPGIARAPRRMARAGRERRPKACTAMIKRQLILLGSTAHSFTRIGARACLPCTLLHCTGCSHNRTRPCTLLLQHYPATPSGKHHLRNFRDGYVSCPDYCCLVQCGVHRGPAPCASHHLLGQCRVRLIDMAYP
jgi:hypothetical protein